MQLKLQCDGLHATSYGICVYGFHLFLFVCFYFVMFKSYSVTLFLFSNYMILIVEQPFFCIENPKRRPIIGLIESHL